MRNISRTGAVRKADKAFSAYIRKLWQMSYGNCPFCGNPIEQCFHILSRVAYSLRWNIRNAIGSCAPCNLRYERDKELIERVIEWYKAKFGVEAWENLKRDWHKPTKLSTSEILEIAKEYEEKLNELCKQD